MDKLITMDDTTHKNLIAERDAAQTRADTLRADLNGIFCKLGVDPTVGPEMRTKAILQICEESNTLGLIAEHLGLSRLDPDTVRRRIQSDAVDLKVSHERVAKVEALLAEECSCGDNARHALSILSIIGDDLIGQAKRRVQQDTERVERTAQRIKEFDAARHDVQTYASAEIKANNRAVKAEARVKELEAMLEKLKSTPLPADIRAELRNLSSAGIKVEPATDPAREELAQIWELWGAGRPMTPGCVYEAALEMERANTKLHMKLGAIAELLTNANLPTHYGRTQDGGPVPLPDRVALLIDSHESARMLAETWETTANREIAERMDAVAELDDLGSPSYAGPIHMTIAARIRALPGLLRQD